MRQCVRECEFALVCAYLHMCVCVECVRVFLSVCLTACDRTSVHTSLHAFVRA